MITFNLKEMTVDEQEELVAGLPAVEDRLYVARSPHTHSDVVLILASDSNTDVRVAVASRRTRDTYYVNYAMAGDKDPEVTRALAGNPLTSSGTLAVLAQSKDRETLELVWEHNNCPNELTGLGPTDLRPVFRYLDADEQISYLESKDADKPFRVAVAVDDGTSDAVVEFLSKDCSTEVREAVAKRTDRGTAERNDRMKKDNPQVTQAIAGNYLTMASTLDDLSYWADRLTLFTILENGNTSEEVRDRIKADLF